MSDRKVKVGKHDFEPFLANMIGTQGITLEEVKKELGKDTVIYYSAGTPWWTHREKDLLKTPGGLPVDPIGCPLLMTEPSNAKKFIEAAESDPENYGKHGLDAFMAAHAMNCRLTPGQSWTLKGWDQYNDLIDVGGKVW